MRVWSRSLTDLFRFRAENVNTLSPNGSWAGPMSPFLPIKHLTLYVASHIVSLSSSVIDSASTSCSSRQSWLKTGSKVEIDAARYWGCNPLFLSYPPTALQHCTIKSSRLKCFFSSGNKFSNTCPRITPSTGILTYANSKFDDNNIQETGGRGDSSNHNRAFRDNVGICTNWGLPATQLWWKRILSGCCSRFLYVHLSRYRLQTRAIPSPSTDPFPMKMQKLFAR